MRDLEFDNDGDAKVAYTPANMAIGSSNKVYKPQRKKVTDNASTVKWLGRSDGRGIGLKGIRVDEICKMVAAVLKYN